MQKMEVKVIMRRLKTIRGVITALAIALPAITLYAVEKHTEEIVGPWEGSGVIFLTHVDKAKFFGEINATMIVQRDENNTINKLPIVCMTIQDIDLNNTSATARGDCLIGVEKDVIFAAFECSGPLGECTGAMTLGGGTGRFSGITGGSKFRLLTVGDMISLERGRVLANKKAKGAMTFTDLIYTIPDTE